MTRKKRGWRAQAIDLCPECGRELQPYEVCECTSKLPRDGLRARCPQFEARASYKGRHYINCGGHKYSFGDKDERDARYMAYCCGGCEGCPVRDKSAVR